MLAASSLVPYSASDNTQLSVVRPVSVKHNNLGFGTALLITKGLQGKSFGCPCSIIQLLSNDVYIWKYKKDVAQARARVRVSCTRARACAKIASLYVRQADVDEWRRNERRSAASRPPKPQAGRDSAKRVREDKESSL